MSGFMDKIIERACRETEEKLRRETAEEVRRDKEEARRETEEARRKTNNSAMKMIASGKLTLEEIADYLSLPLEEVKALAAKKSV